ncbi:MAG: hypothetical protein ACR2H3_02010 [Acidimicrobiales bacterium]
MTDSLLLERTGRGGAFEYVDGLLDEIAKVVGGRQHRDVRGCW